MSTRYWDEIDWYIQEGTQKLCEMLNSEKENEDAASSKWSTGEDDNDHVEEDVEVTSGKEIKESEEDKLIIKSDDMSIKDDADSDKDEEEYMERSTSVEDENTVIIKKQNEVEELLALCTQCSMMPPIYTYFTAGQEQVVSTVQLWNGMRFSSHPQLTRDRAMEEAASEAIKYLKNEQRDKRPVSTSPPSNLPYFYPVQNIIPPQYYNPSGFAPKVTFAPGHPPTYFMPSVQPGQIPYSIMQPAPVVSLPPEYQHAGMVPAYRYEPAGYNPYVPPNQMVRLQVSPTHQHKLPTMYHHPGVPPQPVIWGAGHAMFSDSYRVQDKASVPQQVTTEYRLSDSPVSPKQTPGKQSHTTGGEVGNDVGTKKSSSKSKSDKKENNTRSSSSNHYHHRQNQAKAKLAISFDKSGPKK